MFKTTLCVLAVGCCAINETRAAAAEPFDQAELYLEYNATDGDAEIVVIIDADAGLRKLKITAPNGKKVVNLVSHDAGGLGLRKFNFESPEPGLEEVLEAYPAGKYKIEGTTVDGDRLRSVVTLSHDLPEAPVITFPLDEDGSVPLSGVVGDWDPVSGAVGYAIELEQELEDDEQKLVANIIGDATSFRFPDGWLVADTEGQFGVAAIAANGNVTVTEIQFTTASQ